MKIQKEDSKKEKKILEETPLLPPNMEAAIESGEEQPVSVPVKPGKK